jgi:hypothetical protein
VHAIAELGWHTQTSNGPWTAILGNRIALHLNSLRRTRMEQVQSSGQRREGIDKVKSNIQKRREMQQTIMKIKAKVTEQWSNYFALFREYTSKTTSQIVDEVVTDIRCGVISWHHAPVEVVMDYWCHRRALTELRNAALRRRIALARKSTQKDKSGNVLPKEELLKSQESQKAILKIKEQMKKRWLSRLTADQGYLLKGPDEIINDIVNDAVIDVSFGKLSWDYGPLENVLGYWVQLRIKGELKNASERRKAQEDGRRPKITPIDESSDEKKLVAPVVGSRERGPHDILTRRAVLALCAEHTHERQLAQMILEDPGLVSNKSFRAQEIHQEFKSRGVDLTIEEVRALIERLKKLLNPLIRQRDGKAVQRAAAKPIRLTSNHTHEQKNRLLPKATRPADWLGDG